MMGSKKDFSTMSVLTVIPMARVALSCILSKGRTQSLQKIMNQITAGIQPKMKVPTMSRVVIIACVVSNI